MSYVNRLKKKIEELEKMKLKANDLYLTSRDNQRILVKIDDKGDLAIHNGDKRFSLNSVSVVLLHGFIVKYFTDNESLGGIHNGCDNVDLSSDAEVDKGDT